MNSDIWNDERITAYVFGELTDHNKAAFEAELLQNPSLARAVDEAKSVTGSLSEMFAAEVTPPLEPQRREQIAACASNGQTTPASTAAASHSDARRWIISLAASLLLVGSVGTFWWLGQRTPDGMAVAMQSPPAGSLEKADKVASTQDLGTSEPKDRFMIEERVKEQSVADPLMIAPVEAPLAKDAAPAPQSLPSTSDLSVVQTESMAREAVDQTMPAEPQAMMRSAQPPASALALDSKSEVSESVALPAPMLARSASPSAPAPVAPHAPEPAARSRKGRSEGKMVESMMDGGIAGGGMMGGRSNDLAELSDRDEPMAAGLDGALANNSGRMTVKEIAPPSSLSASKMSVDWLTNGAITGDAEGLGGGMGGGMGPGEGGDQFEPIIENDFRRVSEEPLSTFSIDVDTASFSKSRQYLMQLHRLPPAGAIRIEEWINYFEYRYETPAKDDARPFATRVEMAQCPWNTAHRVVSVGIKGKELDAATLPASNLVFLIDTSGSMNEPNKLPLVKESLRNLVNELRDKDRVAIVVYAGAAGMVLDSTAASDKSKILRSINQMQSGGSTNGGEGIQLAYKIAREHFIKEGNNRVLLCSDGDFNVGTTSTDELVTMVETEAKGGIDLTVLGYGEGNFNDSMLEQISGRGNGNYAFVDNVAEANRVLVKQRAGTLYTIARDVKIQVDFNPRHVAAYRLIGYENRKLNNEDFKDDTKDAGEIGAGHCVTALYELIPAGTGTQELAPEIDESKYQKTKEPTPAAESNEALTVRLRYKLPGEDKSVAVEVPANQNDQSFESAGRDLRLASTVAGFGMSLRNSKHIGNWTLTNVLTEAEKLAADKSDAAINEWVEMIKQARGLVVGEQ